MSGRGRASLSRQVMLTDHCFRRLDKPVSGILILAKGGSAARRAMALMEVADVNKL